MSKIFLSILLLLTTVSLYGKSDSLFVVFKSNKYVVVHKIKQGETLFLLAQRYHVPPAVLSDMNHLNYQADLKKDSMVYIPIGVYNHMTDAHASKDNGKALYYRVRESDNLPFISRTIDVKQSVIQEWNDLSDNTIFTGQILMLGWIEVDKIEVVSNEQNSKTEKPGPLNSKRRKSELPEGIKALLSEEELAKAEAQAQKEIHFSDSISQEHQLFLSQSNHGMYTSDDKGTAVFFDMPGKLKSSKYYVFHSMAKRGTIMRIYNPGTNKTIYAKVLGPIPDNKKYYNAIVGISGGAKVALGVNSDRMWCELSYAP